MLQQFDVVSACVSVVCAMSSWLGLSSLFASKRLPESRDNPRDSAS